MAETGAVASPAVRAVMEGMAAISDEELLDCLATVLITRDTVLQGLVDWACPEYAYVPSKVITDHRFDGTVKSFNAASGYGFIDSPGIKQAFGNDVFVHAGQLGSHQPGSQVNFAVLLNKEHKPQAFDVAAGRAAAYNQKAQRMPNAASGAAADFGWGCKGGAAAGKGFGGKAAAWDAMWDMGGEVPWSMGKGCLPMGKGWGWGDWGCGPGPWGGKGFGGKEGGKEGGKDGKKNNKSPGKSDAPETSHVMPGVTDTRFIGIIKNFRTESGFGFIACPEICSIFNEEIDVFLHHAQLGSFNVGEQVSFSVILNKAGKPQAKDLDRPDATPANKRIRVA